MTGAIIAVLAVAALAGMFFAWATMTGRVKFTKSDENGTEYATDEDMKDMIIEQCPEELEKTVIALLEAEEWWEKQEKVVHNILDGNGKRQ